MASRGINYPDLWGSYGGHHDLAMALASGTDGALSTMFSEFNHAGAETILLSSETLSYANDAEIRRLHGLLSGQPTTIVFYCRRWSELIPSCWHEMVKQGSFRTLPEFALSCLQDPWTCPTLNFELVLARYAAVFGHDSLRIVSYNGVLETDDDLLTHFCRHFLNWPDPPSPGLGRVNVSNDMMDTEIIRALNALEWTRARDGKCVLYPFYLDAKDSLPLFWLIKQMKCEVDAIPLDDAVPGLAQLQAHIAGQYQAALVPPYPDGRLFTPRAAKVWHVRPDYQTSPWVMEMLRGMHAKLLAIAAREAVIIPRSDGTQAETSLVPLRGLR
ncbi:hypothetical protein [Rhodopila sp.]|uniref:hypothetical protein n=1 Tax=Rhodopila sp. TaxID=2480087 RepID=UPI003D0EBF77